MKVTSKENKIKKINPFVLFFMVMNNGFRNFFKGPFARGVKKHWMLYLILLPSLFFLIVFSYLPMFGIVTAFQDFSLAEGVFESEWVGLKAFRYIILNCSPIPWLFSSSCRALSQSFSSFLRAREA
jgi:ABC-type polysaccharide transport system permease subunit